MFGPVFEKRMRLAMLVMLVSVVILAPLIGCFAFSPFLVAAGIQPYPLAAALGCMLSETITVFALVFLVFNAKK